MPQRHIAIVATMHAPTDVRVYGRWTCGLVGCGWRVSLLAPRRNQLVPAMPAGSEYIEMPALQGYGRRVLGAGQVLPHLRRLAPDAVIAVDPELIPVLLGYRRASRAAVFFDRHEPFDQPDAFVRSGRLGKLIAAGYSHFERWASPQLDGVIVVLDSYKPSMNPRTRFITAHNYPTREVLEELGRPAEPGTPSYTVVNLGTQMTNRGFRHMLELARSIVKRHGREDFTLAIGGAFEPGGLEHAQTFQREHGLESNLIIFPSFLPHREALNLMRASRIGVTPLLNNEKAYNSLQNKVLEYMGAGLPVITSPASMNGEVLRAAGCGATFWADQTEEMASTVIRWLDHPDEAQHLGQRGRDYVWNKLSWEAELERVIPWLEESIVRRQKKLPS